MQHEMLDSLVRDSILNYSHIIIFSALFLQNDISDHKLVEVYIIKKCDTFTARRRVPYSYS